MKPLNSGVYSITSPSGTQYIGSTINFTNRWRGHRNNLRNGTHHCTGLQRAYVKYGEAGLRYEVIEVTAIEDLLAVEQFHIDQRGVRNLYNVAPVAGSCRGRVMSVEHKAKISAAQKGRKGTPWTDEQRAKFLAAVAGRQRSPEHAAKLSAALKGRKLTDEQCAKLSASHSGKVLTAEHKAKLGAAQASRKGVPRSAEVRAKIQATWRARVALARNNLPVM